MERKKCVAVIVDGETCLWVGRDPERHPRDRIEALVRAARYNAKVGRSAACAVSIENIVEDMDVHPEMVKDAMDTMLCDGSDTVLLDTREFLDVLVELASAARNRNTTMGDQCGLIAAIDAVRAALRKSASLITKMRRWGDRTPEYTGLFDRYKEPKA